MKIESIRLKNFRAFKDTELKDIPNFCVLVGANGSGKSTLFSVFSFLHEALKSNITVALAKLGGNRGIQEVRSRNSSGPIEIELKFKENLNSPLVTYLVQIDDPNGKAVITRELLKYRRGSKGQPWHFLDFTLGKGSAVINELDSISAESDLQREEQQLKSPDILAIKGLANFEKFPAVMALGNLIEEWHVSDFHIGKARPEQEAGYAEQLSTEGENLSLVLEFLKNNHPQILETIFEKLKERVPGITSVETKPTEEGRLLLKFQDGAFEDPFLARFVSDGTIKMLAYLVLLHDPKPRPLLCIEEPENQLYQSLLYELAEEFRAYAHQGGQVFISTHSPDFLNAVEINELFWLVKENGYTKVKRARDDEQVAAYIEDGDKLGYLWKQGFFEGVSPR